MPNGTPTGRSGGPHSCRGSHPLTLGVIGVLCLWIGACGAGGNSATYLAKGRLALAPIEAEVDSELARYALEKQGSAFERNPALDARLIELSSRYDGRALTNETLRLLSAETSADFAAQYFVQRVLANPGVSQRQRRFLDYVDALRHKPLEDLKQAEWMVRLRRLRWLFVPGWLYEDDPTTGADMARQREFLSSLGLDVRLVRVDQNGTVEANAGQIRDEIRRIGEGLPIILVSASKGGPEVEHALAQMLSREESRSVEAWVSIGGILNGTALADQAQEWPFSWLVGTIFFFRGLDTDSIASMTTYASYRRRGGSTLPPHLRTYVYIAVPLSGTVTDHARGGYEDLKAMGPNDGLTLLPDELLPNATLLFAPGQDHFYRDPEIHLKVLALARLLADDLNELR